MMRRRGLRELLAKPRWPWTGVLVATILLALVVNRVPHHPYVSRQAALGTVGVHEGHSPRVAAKLVLFGDLARADPEVGSGERSDTQVWIIATSGSSGMAGSSGCCSKPLATRWNVYLIKDQPGAPHLWAGIVGVTGDWPPFFDNLPDLAPGS
jgi:hypothetical protein